MIKAFLTQLAFFTLSISISTASIASVTDEAFERLFALSQQQQNAEGAEAPEQQEDTSHPNNEASLIQWLQQNPGVDIGRYKREGTLLQHAVRMDKKALTIWLISQGSDPTTALPVIGDSNLDSLGLAISLEHWDIADALLALPQYKKLSSETLTERYMPFAPGRLDKLLARRFALPKGDEASCLLRYEMEQGFIEQALKLPVNHLLQPDAAQTNSWCKRLPAPRADASLEAFTADNLKVWEKLDARLQEPVFAYLLPTLRTSKDVTALFNAKLKPLSPSALTDAILPWIAPDIKNFNQDGLYLSPEVRKELVAHLPSPGLSPLLEKPAVLRGWIHLATRAPDDIFFWALAQIPDAAAIKQPEIIIKAMTYPEVKNKEPLNIWTELLNIKSLRLDGVNIPSLLEQVPVNAWPALFEHGYRLEQVSGIDDLPPDIVVWLNGTTEDIVQAWPLLTHQSPLLAERAVAVVLRPFGRTDWANCSSAGHSVNQETVDKIRVLIGLGAHTDPAPLLADCAAHTPPEIIAQLLQMNVVAAQPKDTGNIKTRLVRNPPHCRVPDNTNTWLKALSRSTLSKALGRQSIGTVQMVDLPDGACALMLTGKSAPPDEIVREEFFDSPSGGSNPDCVPASLGNGEIWFPADSAGPITNSTEAPGTDTNTLPVRDTADGQLYYVVYPENLADCVITLPPYLMKWTNSAPYTLKVVEKGSPSSDVLLNQCGSQADIDVCIGDPPTSPGTAGLSDKWLDSRPFNSFINDTFAKQHSAYLAAVQAFDLPALKILEQNGVMPDWTLEALEALSHSELPLEEKRRRTAWLFQDGDQLGAALTCGNCGKANEVILNLGNWLPREDWHPIIKALTEKYDSEHLPQRFEKIADLALDNGNPKLACRFYTAIATACPTGAVTKAEP